MDFWCHYHYVLGFHIYLDFYFILFNSLYVITLFIICMVLYCVFGEGNGTPLQYSCLDNHMDGGAWWAAVHGVTEGPTWLSDFTFTFHFHALEKEMATHSSVLAWRIPGMGEPGGLPSMGSHRVRHDWSDLAAAATVLCLNIWLHTFPYIAPSFLDFFVGDFIFLHPFFKKYHFPYYLFLAAPGLQCCVGAFCLCGKCRLISLPHCGGVSCWRRWALGAWASGVAACRP